MCSIVMKLAFFFRAIPTRTLAECKEKCVGGKKSKERINVFFCWNMVGDLEKPFVVGKAANPRSFKGLDRDSLPVQWKSNKKSWMTAAIMEEWLHGFNLKMKNQNRKVLLFLDNATYHPRIKLKKVLQHFLTELENSGSLTELTQKITVRNCVYRVAPAAKAIRPGTVRKCFAKADFKEIEETDDEDNQPLNELADMLRRGPQDIDAEAVVSFDDNLSTEEGVDRAEDDGKNNDEEDESKQAVDKIKSYVETLCAVHDLEEFAASKNCPMLVELMQDSTGLTEKSIIQKTVKQ
ncbi:hypothetical protein PR048_005519 [Dryococelus australis]|uniref:DDE-1 domain-containing protein n=1 Tax=Dryococelus australis TaxID=614101 RepID=A0ABQ9I8I1_9NEOP|nr:hypothetical protein PR048_005519 [Dryococelus australis]